MFSKWERYSRQGINVASAATSAGFSAAKYGTQLGFGTAKTVTSAALNIAGSTVDYALFGSNKGTGQTLGGAASAAISFIENIALAPILLGETLTMTSLVAAQGSIETLSSMFPGSDEASFSLASFITLVRREWNEPALYEYLPPERYSVTEVAKALVAWGALQSVTQDWQEQKWFSALREIDLEELDEKDNLNGLDYTVRERYDSKVHVTEDKMLPENDGQILTADIGEAPSPKSDRSRTPTPLGLRSPVSSRQIRSVLRRYSKMVLGGYGGIGIIFFGLPLIPKHNIENEGGDSNSSQEQRTLANVVDAAEQESSSPFSSRNTNTKIKPKSYSWWDILLGRHDQDIFETYAAISPSSPSASVKDSQEESDRPRPSTAIVIGDGRTPKFWVLTDHGRKQIVLVFRGTMSINELAVDLTCDPSSFRPACGTPEQEFFDARSEFSKQDDGDESDINTLPFPGASTMESSASQSSSSSTQPAYDVHSGMLRMARVMGEKGKPVHTAVRDALRKNRGYELILCGHSLGAGVAGLLALTWADPETCLTVKSSGLPVGRRVSAYCFAPPCLVSASLSEKSRNLITSFVYSHDIVSRLSLGSMRDMTRAAVWLCNANNSKNNAIGKKSDEGYSGVTKRALKWKTGYGKPDDPEWFLAVRKTLEANMQMAHLFPPGRIWWAIHDNDLSPARRLPMNRKNYGNSSPDTNSKSPSNGINSGSANNPVRVFEVLDVEKVFSQIVFARDMLSSHLPDQYDRVLHELI